MLFQNPFSSSPFWYPSILPIPTPTLGQLRTLHLGQPSFFQPPSRADWSRPLFCPVSLRWLKHPKDELHIHSFYSPAIIKLSAPHRSGFLRVVWTTFLALLQSLHRIPLGCSLDYSVFPEGSSYVTTQGPAFLLYPSELNPSAKPRTWVTVRRFFKMQLYLTQLYVTQSSPHSSVFKLLVMIPPRCV